MNKEIIQILIGILYMLIKNKEDLMARSKGEGNIYYIEKRKKW